MLTAKASSALIADREPRDACSRRQPADLTSGDRDAAQARLTFTTRLSDLADCELVIEAAAEDPGLKTALFGELDRVIKSPDAILATSTSSIPIVRLAQATSRPIPGSGPALLQPRACPEARRADPSVLTSVEAADRAKAFAAATLGKTTITAPDRSGFVVNALLVPYLLAAHPDAGSRSRHRRRHRHRDGARLRPPMGPLRLADLIGLDTLASIADSLHGEFREPHYAAPPMLRRMADAGLTGRKTGRGFFSYQEGR